MKLYIKIIILMLILALFYNKIYSQDDNTIDNSSYFDDGGLSERKNIIKYNILSSLNGDASLHYERALAKKFAIEIGAGFLFPNKFIFLEDEFYNASPRKTDNGYSLWLNPKFYIFKNAPEDYYVSFLLRQRCYNIGEQKIIHNDILFNQGIQFIIGKRFSFDISLGFGLRLTKDKSADDKLGFSITVPLGCKFGIIL